MALLINDGFEALAGSCGSGLFCTTGTTYQDHTVGPVPNPALVTTNPRSGAKCLELTVVKAGGGYRAELIPKRGGSPFSNNIREGQEFWFSYSIFPHAPANDGTSEVVWQLHTDATLDAGEKGVWDGGGDTTKNPSGINKSPTIALWIVKGQWIFNGRFDENRVSVASSIKYYSIISGRPIKAGWNDWVFHIKFHFNSSGLMEVWLREPGQGTYQLMGRRTGGNMFNDERPHYMMFGAYKSVWRTTRGTQNTGTQSRRTHRFDNFRVGNAASSFNEITGGTGGSPPTTPPPTTPPPTTPPPTTPPTTSTPPPVITETSPLPSAQVGKFYEEFLSIKDGKAPVKWLATSTIPAGLTLARWLGSDGGDDRTGRLKGTPTTAAVDFKCTFNIQDDLGQTATKDLLITIHEAPQPTPPPPVITELTPLANGQVGVAYSNSISVQDGKAPHTWSATNIPAGLTIGVDTDNRSGLLSGTPTATGTNSMVVTVTDSAAPQRTNNKTLSITIDAAPVGDPPPVITEATPLHDAIRGTSYTRNISVRDGTAPMTWTGTPIPVGLAFSTASDERNGILSGSPSDLGTTVIATTVTDNQGRSNTKNLTLTVKDPPTTGPQPPVITENSPLPSGSKGIEYTEQISVIQGETPMTWTAVNIPVGLTLSTASDSRSGLLSGTPTEPNPPVTYNMNTTVKDKGARTGSKTLQITINPKPAPGVPPSGPTTPPTTTPPGTVPGSGGGTPITPHPPTPVLPPPCITVQVSDDEMQDDPLR